LLNFLENIKRKIRLSLILSILLFFSVGYPEITRAELIEESLRINVGDYVDIDTMDITSEERPTSDFKWSDPTFGERLSGITNTYIAPINTALIAVLREVDFSDVIDCSAIHLTDNKVDTHGDSDKFLEVGTVLVIRTNRGNYAKIRIDMFEIIWGVAVLDVTIVYQNDGSTFVEELKAPMAQFWPRPEDPFEGDIVEFDATESNDPDGTIVLYSWNFGDRSRYSGTEDIVRHSYAKGGVSYPVTLTVRDNHGLETSITKNVRVQQPEKPERPLWENPIIIAAIIGAVATIVTLIYRKRTD
jgi:hypothetical protein